MTGMWRETPIELALGDIVGCDKAILKEGEGEVVKVTSSMYTLRAECGREAAINGRDKSLRLIRRAKKDKE